MTAFVLDASVGLRWLLDKSVPAYAVRIENLLLSGARALVPSLWHLEVANALVVAERRRILPATDLDRALQRVEQVVGHSIETDSDFISSRQACSLARSWRLSAYDATYLHLAQRKSLPLATLDNALIAAARTIGVEIA